jgi:Mg-chelatase subunit ChlD
MSIWQASNAYAADPSKIGISSETQKVTVFGVEGKGSKFVYVLDRSGSMGVPDNKPMKAAQAELIASINQLTPQQQFYLISYNHEPRMLDVTGAPGRLSFASDANKDAAKKLIESIKADGGTNHEAALAMAMKFRPDVIFLLSDGDPEDDISKDELVRLNKINFGAAIINVIQFSAEPKKGENRLINLAKESGGEHSYVDILKFKRDK